MDSLKRWLTLLGIKGKVTAYPMQGDHRILVMLNDGYFGMWDSHRETFVD